MNYVKMEERIPVKEKYNVIVAGGGVAGVAAAVSAKRAGKNVLLIEKSISLGGLATIGLVNLFVPLCNGRGVQIIKGMAEELLRLSVKYGYDTISDEWKDGCPPVGTTKRYFTRFSAPIFTLALTELIKNEGVDILFDTVVSTPIMDGKHCSGLVVENKSGREYYGAKVVIDATGDADVLYRAGVPTVQGNNYHTYYVHGANLESCKETVKQQDFSKLQVRFFGGEADLYGKKHPKGIPYWQGTNVKDVTDYVVTNHLEALKAIKNHDRKERDILNIPAMCQFRTTRRIDGDYTLTVGDKYKHFEDSIGAICDFENRDFLYEVPYRVLINTGFDNLITAGRTASAEGYAWDVLRVIPPAIITGQAAGRAAALAVDSNSDIHDIDVKKLQKMLENENVMIHFDNNLIPTTQIENIAKEDIGHF